MINHHFSNSVRGADKERFFFYLPEAVFQSKAWCFKETQVDIMKKSVCETNSEVKELYWTLIANGVFNSFLSYTAIMLNIVTIHAIRKTSSMPRSLKTLLLSLAVSDVGVGLLGQPLYISLLIKRLQQIVPNCSTYQIFLHRWQFVRYSFVL